MNSLLITIGLIPSAVLILLLLVIISMYSKYLILLQYLIVEVILKKNMGWIVDDYIYR